MFTKELILFSFFLIYLILLWSKKYTTIFILILLVV